MTQWRGDDWPTVTHSDFVFTAAETAESYHRILMRTRPEEYERKQQIVAELMAEDIGQEQ